MYWAPADKIWINSMSTDSFVVYLCRLSHYRICLYFGFDKDKKMFWKKNTLYLQQTFTHVMEMYCIKHAILIPYTFRNIMGHIHGGSSVSAKNVATIINKKIFNIAWITASIHVWFSRMETRYGRILMVVIIIIRLKLKWLRFSCPKLSSFSNVPGYRHLIFHF